MSTTAAATAPRPRPIRDTDPEQERYWAQADARKKGLDAMLTFKVNDVSVFDTAPTDLMHSAAQEAHALCTVLSVSIAEMTDFKTGDLPLRAPHIATAISAIGTLIALSMFAGEGRSLEK